MARGDGTIIKTRSEDWNEWMKESWRLGDSDADTGKTPPTGNTCRVPGGGPKTLRLGQTVDDELMIHTRYTYITERINKKRR